MKANKNNESFWKSVNAHCWTFSWELYNPKMLSTLQGFVALVHCWKELRVRLMDNVNAGNDVKYFYDVAYKHVHYAMLSPVLKHLGGTCFLAMPLIPKDVKRYFPNISWTRKDLRNNFQKLKLTRETVMFLQPVNICNVTLNDVTKNTLEGVFTVHRAKKQVRNEDIGCRCGRCEQSFTETIREIEQSLPIILRIAREKHLTYDSTGLRLIDFADHTFHLHDLRQTIFMYYLMYVWNSEGDMPNKKMQSYFATGIAHTIPYTVMRNIFDDLYELFAEFRTKLGPKGWNECLNDRVLLASGLVPFYKLYADHKRW